jgi:hypothetical protein
MGSRHIRVVLGPVRRSPGFDRDRGGHKAQNDRENRRNAFDGLGSLRRSPLIRNLGPPSEWERPPTVTGDTGGHLTDSIYP